MSKFTKSAESAPSPSITEQLIEAIEKLSDSQQEYLLVAVRDWLQDRRDYPRKKCQTDVIYSDSNRLAQGMIVNLSASGIYLQPDSPFAVGQEIILTFEHPFSKKQIKVTGRIVRSDQQGIGVSFDRNIGSSL